MRCSFTPVALPLAALLVAALPAGALPAEALLAGALPAEALLAGVQETSLQEAEAQEARRARDCPECPRCPPTNCSYNDLSGLDEYFYTVDGEDLRIEWTEAYVKLICPAGLAPDGGSLPAFPTRALRPAVVLDACPPAALRRLNVTVLDALELRAAPPASPLSPGLLAGLPRLRSLTLEAEPARRRSELPLEVPPELLEPLKRLQMLSLADVRMSRAALERLPPSLVSLSLVRCDLEELPASALGRLPELRLLKLSHRSLACAPPLEAAPALRSLHLDAPLDEMPRLDRLENVTLAGVREVTLRGSCAALRRLGVSSRAAALPGGWLHAGGAARCPRLAALRLTSLALSALPADLLRFLDALRELTVSHCRELRALPSDLFEYTRDLRRLVLAHDALEVLPSGIFAPLRELEELDLSGNRLKALGGGVRSLVALRVLALDRNPLGDTCGGGSSHNAMFTTSSVLSPLHELRELRELSLAHTGASQLCVDWRRDLHELVKIDFSYNDMSELKHSDMEWYGGRGRRTTVDLRGNPLRAVTVSQARYRDASYDSSGMSRAVLTFDAEINCTCHTYWAARALREARPLLELVELVGLKCAGTDSSLAAAPLERMTCAETRACPARCACSLHPANATLELRCAPRPALPDLAAPAGLELPLALRLAGASLASLPDALPARLRLLDLRDATLPAATERQAAALLAHARVVLLAGARVSCACAGGARPALLRALLAHPAGAPDLRAARCAGSGRLVGEEPPCARALWPAALGALAGAALLLAGAWRVARRDSRLRLKVFLLARGLFPGWTRRKDDDDDCRYDVFISFSHRDFEVASQIVRKLEEGPRPLRVCVHYRDWRAGEWIPEQIARSVRQSRRTLVLMSEHFARSEWARAELREAAERALRDVTPRLLVALLQPAPPACLDAELAHIVRSNTYARWGEAAFWERLRLALPPGRPRAAAVNPPAPPAPQPAPPAPQPAPPTPIIKFSQMDFPSPIKKHVTETSSPCA